MYTLNLSSIVEQTPQQQLDSQPAVVLGKEEQNSGGEGHCKDEQQNYVEHMHDQQRELEPPNVDRSCVLGQFLQTFPVCIRTKTNIIERAAINICCV